MRTLHTFRGRLASAAAVLGLIGMTSRAAGGQTFRYCYSYDLPNCTTVTFTVTPPEPGTPPYYPGFPPPTMLKAHFVHEVRQLTVNDPDYGPVYLGPYQLSDAYYFPQFYPGGGSFYPGPIDDAPWMWGGTGMNTEGTYVFDDVHAIIGPGKIVGLSAGTEFRSFTFTRVESTVTPEPASLALVATGLLALGAAATRGRRGAR